MADLRARRKPGDRPRRRDRRGRGLRGPLLPPELPAARSRSERFDDLVPDAAELPVFVHEVVVEQVASALGLEPERIDPGYGRD